MAACRIIVKEFSRDKYGNAHITDENGVKYQSSKKHPIEGIVELETVCDVLWGEFDGKKYINKITAVNPIAKAPAQPSFTPPGKKEEMSKSDWEKKDELIVRMNINTNATNMAMAYKDLVIANTVTLDQPTLEKKWADIEEKRRLTMIAMYQFITGKTIEIEPNIPF